MQVFTTDFEVLELPLVSVCLVCRNNCSGHGYCDRCTKMCVCESFWMQDFFKVHFGTKESNCGKVPCLLSGPVHVCGWDPLLNIIPCKARFVFIRMQNLKLTVTSLLHVVSFAAVIWVVTQHVTPRAMDRSGCEGYFFSRGL